MYVFFLYFYSSSGTYWEITAHSAYDIFSKYKYLIVNLVFPTSGFGVGISFRLRFFLIIAFLYLFSIPASILPFNLTHSDLPGSSHFQL